jgi:hypothetical protein
MVELLLYVKMLTVYSSGEEAVVVTEDAAAVYLRVLPLHMRMLLLCICQDTATVSEDSAS